MRSETTARNHSRSHAKPQCRKNAIELSETRFHADANRLIEAIEKSFSVVEEKAELPATPVAPSPESAAARAPEAESKGCALDAALSAKGLSKRDLFSDNGSRSSAWTGEKPKPADAFTKSKAIMQSTGDSDMRPFDWKSCVEAFTEKHAEHIAKWRGYSIEFLRELRDQKLIGIHYSLVAFPVEHAGQIAGAHFRLKTGDWRYAPVGIKAAPFVFGELVPGERVQVFESTWDGLDYLDKSGERDGVIIARGASNAKLAAALLPEGATCYVWPQNDEAGAAFEAALIANTQCAAKRVKIPAPYKDLNEWTRADVTPRTCWERW